MNLGKGWFKLKYSLLGSLFCVAIIVVGYATVRSETSNLAPNRPQEASISVSPAKLHRDAMTILKTPVTFVGFGFYQGEDVSVEWIGIGEDGSDIGVAYGIADGSGAMKTEMSSMTKINTLLRSPWDGAKPLLDKSNILPLGKYKIKASGLMSGKIATCSIELVAPMEKK